MSPCEPRTIAITGGHGDLGQALAAEFRRHGYTVLAPGRAELDVTQPEQVRAWFAGLPALDVLVCNAGVAENELAVKVTLETWQRQLHVNLRGAFLCAQAAIPLLTQSRSAGLGGHVITIGSHSALAGNAGQAAYAAAKAGLVGLTHSLAQELGEENVRVNCVLPGLLRTRMTRDLTEQAWQAALEKHVLHRLNEPADAARFICMLDNMPHTSGQVFQLDSRVTPWT